MSSITKQQIKTALKNIITLRKEDLQKAARKLRIPRREGGKRKNVARLKRDLIFEKWTLPTDKDGFGIDKEHFKNNIISFEKLDETLSLKKADLVKVVKKKKIAHREKKKRRSSDDMKIDLITMYLHDPSKINDDVEEENDEEKNDIVETNVNPSFDDFDVVEEPDDDFMFQNNPPVVIMPEIVEEPQPAPVPVPIPVQEPVNDEPLSDKVYEAFVDDMLRGFTI